MIVFLFIGRNPIEQLEKSYSEVSRVALEETISAEVKLLCEARIGNAFECWNIQRTFLLHPTKIITKKMFVSFTQYHVVRFSMWNMAICFWFVAQSDAEPKSQNGKNGNRMTATFSASLLARDKKNRLRFPSFATTKNEARGNVVGVELITVRFHSNRLNA